MNKKNHSRRQTSLEGAFTAIARAQSKHWGVQIVASGSELSTDGDTIYFPWNADDIKGISFQVLNGYLDHEVGHVAEESEHRSVGQTTPLTLMRRNRNATKGMLFNVFEDIRMEIKRGHLYPGVSTNLHAANLYSVKKFRSKFAGKELDPRNFWHTLGCGIILEARGCDISWMPEGYKPFMDTVASEIAASRTIEWGKGSWELACSVYDKIRDLAGELMDYEDEKAKKAEEKAKKAEESQPGAGAGSEADEGDSEADEGEGSEGDEGGRSAKGADDEGEGQDKAGEGAAPGEGDEEGQPSTHGERMKGDAAKGAPSEGDGEGDAAASEGAPCEDADKAAEIAEGAFTDSDTDHIMDEVGKSVKEASERQAESHHGYLPHPANLAADKWITPQSFAQPVYNDIKTQVAKQVSALRAKLIRIIRTRTESRTQYDQDNGRLDTDSLHQLRLGNKRVFSKTLPGEELDTAVTVLVDLSASMGSARDTGSRSHFARMTTIALAETFDALGVPFEIIGFNNTYSRKVDDQAPPKGPFVRRLPFDYHVYKSFNDQFKRVRTRMVGITGREENADGEAVLATAKRLAVRSESRKLMFVISDGSPCCPGLNARGSQHLSDVVKQVRESGIQLFGIGVQHRSIEHYYGAEYSIVVNKLDTMAANIFKVVRTALISGLRRRAA